MVDALDPTSADRVIEIGPGKGSLTRRLAVRVAVVVAIEKDERLAAALTSTEMPGNVRIVTGDALRLDWASLVSSGNTSLRPFKVIGNIPYYATSPLIEKALTPPLPTVIVFLIQREVADRLVAQPGSRAFGALTVGVRVLADVEPVFRVPAGAFRPRPQVDSAGVRFRPLPQPLVDPMDHRAFRTFVNALFSRRRKQLIGSLQAVATKSRDEVSHLLATLDVDPTARAEMLSPQTFVRLFHSFAR